MKRPKKPPRQSKPLLAEYVRVTSACRCPVCGRPDWCLIHENGRKAICSRKKSGRQYNSRKGGGPIGWLHYLGDKVTTPDLKAKAPEHLTPQQVTEYMRRLAKARHVKMIERHAADLGLSLEALIAMYTAYEPDKAVLALPMFNGRKQPIGVRFRRADGRKWSLTGSQNGLFLSRDFTPYKPGVITEGATDGAAAWIVGLKNVIGRPNCCTGGEYVKELLAMDRQTPWVIISDPNDVGVDGSIGLANLLPNPCQVIAGPCDLREFVTKNLHSDCRATIIEGVNGDDTTPWRPIFCNNAGRFFDFQSSHRVGTRT